MLLGRWNTPSIIRRWALGKVFIFFHSGGCIRTGTQWIKSKMFVQAQILKILNYVVLKHVVYKGGYLSVKQVCIFSQFIVISIRWMKTYEKSRNYSLYILCIDLWMKWGGFRNKIEVKKSNSHKEINKYMYRVSFNHKSHLQVRT